MLKQPIYYEFNLDAKTSPSKLIAISHVDDKYSEVIEVAVKQNDRFVYMGGATVVARMVLHRDKDYLLSDDVHCTVNANGNILIPFDNAVVKTLKGIVKIEVSITRGTDELTLQFPLWVSVNGSILDDAEVTPESEGTIPDLLKEAADALEDATEALGRLGSYSNLEDKPQIDGVTLDGDQTPAELGLQKTISTPDNYLQIYANGQLAFSSGLVIKNSSIISAERWFSGAMQVVNTQYDLSQYQQYLPQNCGFGLYIRMGEMPVSEYYFADSGKIYVQTAENQGSWIVSGWREISGGSQLVSGVVNQNGTITFTDSDGNTFTTTGSSVIGPQGAPGDDYVLTAQDKADIADIVLQELPTTQGVLYGN